MSLPSLTILIPTLNAGPQFEQVLQRLRSQNYNGPVDLRIIDSASEDSTVSLAKKYLAHTTIIRRRDFNHGLTRNLGIQSSISDLILLISQDALPADDFLFANFAKNFADPLVGGCYARQIPRENHDVLVQRNVRSYGPGQSTRRESFITNRPTYEALTPMNRLDFCLFDDVCSCIRRATWLQLPFRKTDFAEDLHWSKRALEAGWKIVFDPTAAVIHSHARTIREEFQRSLLGHRVFHEIFGLHLIPDRRSIFRSVQYTTKYDLAYLWSHEPRLLRKLAISAQIPFIALAGALGQYLGARDSLKHSSTRAP